MLGTGFTAKLRNQDICSGSLVKDSALQAKGPRLAALLSPYFSLLPQLLAVIFLLPSPLWLLVIYSPCHLGGQRNAETRQGADTASRTQSDSPPKAPGTALAIPPSAEMDLTGSSQTLGNILCLLCRPIPTTTPWLPLDFSPQPVASALESERAPGQGSSPLFKKHTFHWGVELSKPAPRGCVATQAAVRCLVTRTTLPRRPSSDRARWPGSPCPGKSFLSSLPFLHSTISPLSVSTCHYITLHSSKLSSCVISKLTYY